MKPIAIFYHCLFFGGDLTQELPRASQIVYEQMNQLKGSGLLNAANEFYACVNGRTESMSHAEKLLPKKAVIVYHGLEYKNENATLVLLHLWAKQHPGWNVLYMHSKGVSKIIPSEISHSDNWRHCMMRDLVTNWRKCIDFLETGFDVVCSHWKWSQCDGTQHIPAGNFLWTTSDFVAKLPDMRLRQRIKDDGIGALSSRYEAECFWGNGPRPRVFQFRPEGAGMP